MVTIFFNTWKALLKAEKRKFFFLVLGGITISLLDIIFLAGLLGIVQFYMGEKLPFETQLPTLILNRNSIILIAVFFGLFLLKSICAILLTGAENRFNSKVGVRLAHEKLKDYLEGSISRFTEIDSSVHFRNIHLQPLEFCQYLLTGMQQVVMQLTLITFVIAAVLVFNAQLFLLLLAVLLPPVFVVFYFVRKKLSLAKRQLQYHNERSFQHLSEALKGYIEGNIFQANDFLLERFTSYRKKFSSYLFQSLTLQSLPSRIIESAAILGLVLIILFAKQLQVGGSLLLTIGAFIAAAYKIIPGIVRIINLASQVRAHGFMAESLRPPVKDVPVNSNKEVIEKISVHNLDFSFNGIPVLTGFSMMAKKGCFLGIKGSSGKGKTTLFNVILGFYRSSEGKIKINGIDRSANELKTFWPSISYVRQQNFLLNDSLVKNICLQETGWDMVRLQWAVHIAGLDEMVRINPAGLGMQITENGKNISGGQRQRIALARAFYKDAQVILLDEPCSELDEASECILMQYFKELAEQGRIIIMITHNTKSLDFCHKIISLDEMERQITGHSYARVPGI